MQGVQDGLVDEGGASVAEALELPQNLLAQLIPPSLLGAVSSPVSLVTGPGGESDVAGGNTRIFD